jgi:hypothetical protein
LCDDVLLKKNNDPVKSGRNLMLHYINKHRVGLLTALEKFVKISLFEEGECSRQKGVPIIRKRSSLSQELEHMCVINRESSTKRYCEDLHSSLSVPPLG